MRVTAEQRRLLRRILVTFVVVIALLPFVVLGGQWSWLLLPLLAAAAFGLVTAISLRRSVRRSADPFPTDDAS